MARIRPAVRGLTSSSCGLPADIRDLIVSARYSGGRPRLLAVVPLQLHSGWRLKRRILRRCAKLQQPHIRIGSSSDVPLTFQQVWLHILEQTIRHSRLF